MDKRQVKVNGKQGHITNVVPDENGNLFVIFYDGSRSFVHHSQVIY